MNYLKFIQKGLRYVVRLVLEEIQANGLKSFNDPAISSQIIEPYFCINFKTNFPGVVIPHYLLEKYPNSMVIVLQHEFWNLKVFSDHFTVDLVFGGVQHNLSIPFEAIYKFEDPSQDFALDFIVEEPAPANKVEAADNIIDLNAFRKKDE
jgi:hypothetical protein